MNSRCGMHECIYIFWGNFQKGALSLWLLSKWTLKSIFPQTFQLSLCILWQDFSLFSQKDQNWKVILIFLKIGRNPVGKHLIWPIVKDYVENLDLNLKTFDFCPFLK